MKKLLFLLLVPFSLFAQIEVGQDTTIRPSKTTTVRPVVKNNNIYYVPRTGNVIEGISTLKSFSEFSTYTNKYAIYNGSTWEKVTGGSSTTASLGYGSMVTASVGGFYYQRSFTSHINVKWFGAKGDASTNDSPAIQAAIDFAKSRVAPNSGIARAVVELPIGSYRINTTLNFTNATGISIVGAGDYQQVTLDGNTGGIMIDATGTTRMQIANIFFYAGPPGGGNNPSTIAIQYALSQTSTPGASFVQGNGLRSSVKNCWFDLKTNNTANGGAGSIGILACRSEEISVTDCVIAADSPMILTSSAAIVTRNASFSAASAFTQIAVDGSGSQGVVHVSGTSLTASNHYGHALTLNGVNALDFQGYLWGFNSEGSAGSETHAIGLYKTNLGIHIKGTLEGYPGAILLGFNANGTQLIGGRIQLQHANMPNITTDEIVMLPGTNPALPTRIETSDISIIMANGSSEIGTTRKFISTPLVSSGDAPTTCMLISNNLSSPSWINPTFIDQYLLRNTTGVNYCHTGQPFTIKNGIIEDNKSYAIPLGTFGTVLGGGVKVVRFSLFDKPTYNVNGGGFYSAEIDGIITIGDETSTDHATYKILSTITVNQNVDGTRQTGFTTTIITSGSTSSSAVANLTGVIPTMEFISPNSNLKLQLVGTGSGTTLPVSFLGTVRFVGRGYAKNSSIYD